MQMTKFETQIHMDSKLIYGEDEHSQLYARFRPTYPEYIYQDIYAFCEKDKHLPFSYELAVDVGCGSGQSAQPLCSKFRRVIGCDISPTQIRYARRDYENLEYKVCRAEDMSFLANSSVNLISVGTAFHFLDRDNFSDEVNRVLKPGGVLAVYAYGMPFTENESAQSAIQLLYDTIYPYWCDEQFAHLDLYKDEELPFKDQIRFDEDMVVKTTVENFIGLLSSFQAYRDFRKDKPADIILEKTRERLCNIYGDNDIAVRYPIWILLGRKPAGDV